MKRNYVIIGLGRFGLSLVEELSSFSDEVIAIDLNAEAVKMASTIIPQAYIADSTSEIALKNIGVQNADHVVIAFGENFEGTVMTFATLKELGVKNITVRCDKDTYVPILTKLGVTDMVSPTKLAATRLASRIVTPSFVDYFKLANDYCVVELPVPETFESTKVIDLNTRNKFDVNLLLIKRNKQTFSPRANDEIISGDELFVFGTRQKIDEFSKFLKTRNK